MSNMQEHWDAVRERAVAFQRVLNASIASRLDASGIEILIRLLAEVRREAVAMFEAVVPDLRAQLEAAKAPVACGACGCTTWKCLACEDKERDAAIVRAEAAENELGELRTWSAHRDKALDERNVETAAAIARAERAEASLVSAICGRCGAMRGTHGSPCIDDVPFMARVAAFRTAYDAGRASGAGDQSAAMPEAGEEPARSHPAPPQGPEPGGTSPLLTAEEARELGAEGQRWAREFATERVVLVHSSDAPKPTARRKR